MWRSLNMYFINNLDFGLRYIVIVYTNVNKCSTLKKVSAPFCQPNML